MKHAVILKSYTQGIKLILDAEEEFAALLEEIGDKFKESADFFKDAKIALSIEGRRLSLEQEAEVIEVIENHSQVRVRCIIERDEKEGESYVRAMEEIKRRFPTPSEQMQCQIHLGTLQEGETLQFSQNVLILGDVEEGALVVSDKSVLIMGALRGEVFAGAGQSEACDAFVLALDFAPSRIKLGPYRVSDKELKGKQRIGRRKNKGAQLAFLDREQEKIQVEQVESSRFAELLR